MRLLPNLRTTSVPNLVVWYMGLWIVGGLLGGTAMALTAPANLQLRLPPAFALLLPLAEALGPRWWLCFVSAVGLPILALLTIPMFLRHVHRVRATPPIRSSSPSARA